VFVTPMVLFNIWSITICAHSRNKDTSVDITSFHGFSKSTLGLHILRANAIFANSAEESST
jgi:hypothetical protein